MLSYCFPDEGFELVTDEGAGAEAGEGAGASAGEGAGAEAGEGVGVGAGASAGAGEGESAGADAGANVGAGAHLGRVKAKAAQNAACLHKIPLDAMLSIFDQYARRLLRDDALLAIDGAAFLAMWLRRPSLAKTLELSAPGGASYGEPFSRVGDGKYVSAQPVGIVCHWIAGNVPTLAIYSLVQSLLCKNYNVMRLPQGSLRAVIELLKPLAGIVAAPGGGAAQGGPAPIGPASALRGPAGSRGDVAAKQAGAAATQGGGAHSGLDLLRACAIVHYPSDSAALNAELSMMADARVAWGGMDAIDSINMLAKKTACRDVIFGPRYSIAVFDRTLLECPAPENGGGKDPAGGQSAAPSAAPRGAEAGGVAASCGAEAPSRQPTARRGGEEPSSGQSAAPRATGAAGTVRTAGTAGAADGRLAALLDDLAGDIIAFEQKACSSPQMLFMEKNGRYALRAFAELVAEALGRASAKSPKLSIGQYDATRVINARAMFALSPGDDLIVSPGGGLDWTVLIIGDGSASGAPDAPAHSASGASAAGAASCSAPDAPDATGSHAHAAAAPATGAPVPAVAPAAGAPAAATSVAGAPATAATAPAAPATPAAGALALEEALQNRTLYIREVSDAFDVAGAVSERVQTVGAAFGDAGRLFLFADAVMKRGADRVVRPGFMNFYDSPWDGHLLAGKLTRWCSVSARGME